MSKERDPSDYGTPPKRVILRKKLKGENIKAIRETLNQVRNEDISVHEFVTLISPHTADKGECLTKVMTDELNAFRRMVVKVYDTMTQDVSDVLANEQIDLARMYSEKLEQLKDRIRRALKDLGRLNPDFNFNSYYRNPNEYIATMFRSAELPDDEEIETAQRHIAYHRLQWLKSEGERLQEENNKLQQRLNELKKEQRSELKESVKKEVEVEKENAELEQEQAQLQDKLEELSTSLQKAIVVEEKKTQEKRKKGGVPKGKGKRAPERPAWQDVEVDDFANMTAAEIESTHIIGELKGMKSSAARGVGEVTRVQPLRSNHPEAGPSTSRQPSPQQTVGRRSAGPRDSWGGFN